MWKNVKPYFLSYHYGIILSFKVCNLKSILKQYPASLLESHILLVHQCHGGWNLDPSFWTWIQVAVSVMTPYNILKEDEIQEFTVEILGTFFRLIKLLFFWTSCLVPRCITVKSDHYIEMLFHLNACLHWVCPTRKMSQVLHYHGSAQLHTSAHITEAITKYRVATSTLQFLPCTSRLLSVSSLKKRPARTPLCQWQCTTEYHVPVAADGGEQLLPGRNTFSYTEVEEDFWQLWGYIAK